MTTVVELVQGRQLAGNGSEIPLLRRAGRFGLLPWGRGRGEGTNERARRAGTIGAVPVPVPVRRLASRCRHHRNSSRHRSGAANHSPVDSTTAPAVGRSSVAHRHRGTHDLSGKTRADSAIPAGRTCARHPQRCPLPDPATGAVPGYSGRKPPSVPFSDQQALLDLPLVALITITSNR